MGRLSRDDLVTVALDLLEELAAKGEGGPVERPRWLRFMLAWLWLESRGERWPFDAFWRALAGREAIGRAQSLTASLNGIWRQLGRDPSRRRPHAIAKRYPDDAEVGSANSSA
jgi:hypothetical protein